MRRDLTMGPLYTTVRQEKRMLRYTYLGSLCILAAFGCGDSVNQATTSGTAAGGGGAGGDDCWYCGDGGSGGMAGVGGATTGKTNSSSKASGGGKGDGVTITWQGVLDTKTGDGTYSIVYTTDEKVDVCDVSFTIEGATLDPSCAACTFAYAMPLTMPVVTADSGCNGEDKLTATKWGHTDPDTVMFEKSGMYNAIKDGGTSKVEGDTWEFGFVYYIPGDGGGGK